jgi:hypothetical protein
MPSPVLPRRRRLPALLVATVAASGMLAVSLPSASAAPAASTAVVANAAGYVASHLTAAGTVEGSFPNADGTTTTFTDWGRTLDSALALLAAGGQDATLGRTLASVEEAGAVAAYTQGAPFDAKTAAYVGATAKLAFVVAVTGGDPTKVGGIDLLAQLASLQQPSGRYKDSSDFGDFANVFGHSFAILALQKAGRAVPDVVVQALLSTRCSDGSFPESYDPATGKPCTGSVDATGLVLQALAAIGLGASAQATDARTWLTSQQAADGSFPGQAPVNSTGYALLGLDAVGGSPGNGLAYLVGQQNSDGGLRRGTSASTASDLFATAQALPALAGKTFLASARTVVRPQCLPGGATAALDRSIITATGGAVVTVHAAPNSAVELQAYSRPSTTYRVVRAVALGSDGVATFTIRPGTNTRLLARQSACTAGQSVVLNVRTALTLAAKRNAARDITFSGDSLPARAGGLIVSLYRVTESGSEVLTAQTRASATTGEWSVHRVFTDSGRFRFVVRTGQDLQNAPGSSNVRTLLV